MKTTIDISCESGVWAVMRITNNEDTAVSIHNPGNYPPTEGWECSREAYRVAVLRSFHFLEMILRTKDGSEVAPEDIYTLVDHEVEMPLELEPGAELRISIPLHEFYDLKRHVEYSLALTYGDDSVRVSAATQVRCSEPAGPEGLQREGRGA
jgi:hypothetical protein